MREIQISGIKKTNIKKNRRMKMKFKKNEKNKIKNIFIEKSIMADIITLN